MSIGFIAKKGEMMLLEGGEAHMVVEQIAFEGENYLLLKRVTDSLTDYMDLKKEVSFVREVVENETDYSVETVTSKTLLKSLFDEAKKKVQK
mgnify:CR=1 FL=1